MPSPETLERFIARVEQNAHLEAVEAFGTVTRLEELAWQRWEGERIAQEQFFYDPAQRAPVRRQS